MVEDRYSTWRGVFIAVARCDGVRARRRWNGARDRLGPRAEEASA